MELPWQSSLGALALPKTADSPLGSLLYVVSASLFSRFSFLIEDESSFELIWPNRRRTIADALFTGSFLGGPGYTRPFIRRQSIHTSLPLKVMKRLLQSTQLAIFLAAVPGSDRFRARTREPLSSSMLQILSLEARASREGMCCAELNYSLRVPR